MEKDYNLELSLAAAPKDLRVERLLSGETLLRLHPHWFVEAFEGDAAGVTAHIRDYASEERFRLRYRLGTDSAEAGLPRLVFEEGPLQEIRFHLRGQALHAQVRSDQAFAALEERFGLVLWLRGIREYIRLYLKRTPNTLFFRFLMNRVLLSMNPSQRKISIMIAKITVVELLLILAVVIGFVYFNR